MDAIATKNLKLCVELVTKNCHFLHSADQVSVFAYPCPYFALYYLSIDMASYFTLILTTTNFQTHANLSYYGRSRHNHKAQKLREWKNWVPHCGHPSAPPI